MLQRFFLSLCLVTMINCSADEAAPGAMGTMGIAGPQGPAGATGPQGIAGPTGAAGERGPQGVAGPMGAPGPAGAAGVNGTNGANGAPGIQGNDGVDGVDGRNGSSTVVINNNGVTVGFPVMIDRGTNGFSMAVFAYQLVPGATFPQDKLISATELTIIFFTGANCTGTPHMNLSEVSPTYGKNVGYVLNLTNDLYFPTTGTTVSPTTVSYSLGNACGVGPAAGSLIALTKSTKVFTIAKPWQMAHN
jgi:hypothetical protein